MEKLVNEVIEELSKVNNAAAGFAESAEKSKRKLEQEFRAQRDEFDKVQGDIANEKLEKVRSELEAENKTVIDRLHTENEDYLDRLEKSFEENHTQWAQEIVARILAERL